MQTIQAGELKAGDEVIERGGYVLRVAEVVKRTPRTITVRVIAPLSITMRGDGATMTLRTSSRVCVPSVAESAS